MLKFVRRVAVLKRFIFYANEYLGTGNVLKEAKIRQLQVNNIKRRDHISKLPIKLDMSMQMGLQDKCVTKRKGIFSKPRV
jgi:hypothetical protein